ncbi:MAG: cytochrome c oxidase subunit I [Chthonomonadales bacterium]
MSVQTLEVNAQSAPEPSEERVNYLNVDHSLKSWLLTLDHKRIAILYMVSISLMFVLGGAAAAMVRLELTSPHGLLLSNETYNKMFSAHGIIMVFFFMVPSIPAVLGNFCLPLMIGCRDLAFPRLNLLSWYLFTIGGIVALAAILSGGVDTGWTFYTPFSSVYSNSNVVATIIGVFIAGFSSIATGLNFIVTVHKMRAPGLTWFRLPLFVWAIYATSVIIVLGTPVVAITLLLVVVERTLHLGIFDPALGGDPVLFQHMFWFYSHPAVYIMILPSMGVMSEVISAFCRKRIFGYKFVAFSSIAIAVFGFLVWGHHMFVSSQSVYAGMVFSVLSFMVAVPSAIKTFNWTATVYKGRVWFTAPMLFALGFMGLFVVGGLTGLYLACLATDVHLHDTYFVIAHFHYIMVGGAIMGYMAGLHFWWPKMTGKLYPENWAKLAAGIIFIGFNLTFFPQFILGWLGNPRRYHIYPEEFQVWHVLSSAGSSILAVGYIIPLFYLLWSLKYGREAGRNPWGAVGLEWTHADSPPHPHNFHEVPVVTWEAYAYEPEEVEEERYGRPDVDAEAAMWAAPGPGNSAGENS